MNASASENRNHRMKRTEVREQQVRCVRLKPFSTFTTRWGGSGPLAGRVPKLPGGPSGWFGSGATAWVEQQKAVSSG